MSATIEEEVKRWTARRKSALMLEIIQGKTTVSKASRQACSASTRIRFKGSFSSKVGRFENVLSASGPG